MLSQCLPKLSYGNAAATLTSSDVTKLSFVFDSIYYKLFNVKEKAVIAQCQFYTGTLSFNLYYEMNRLIFLRTLITHDCLNAKVELDNSDLTDYNMLKVKIFIDDRDSIACIKRKVWNYFEQFILQS